MKKPIIGVSAVNIFDDSMYMQRVTYPQAIWANGGETVLLPCNTNCENVPQVVAMIDGLLSPGGGDVTPFIYNCEKKSTCGKTNLADDNYDIALIKETLKQGKPVLAICRGLQIVNAMYGGTLYQDIPTECPSEIDHSMGSAENVNTHHVTVDKDSKLAEILGETDIITNTSHHQAIKLVAPGFKVVARADDGTVEAIENRDGSIIAVQWHPERMQDKECQRRLIKHFVEKCSK